MSEGEGHGRSPPGRRQQQQQQQQQPVAGGGSIAAHQIGGAYNILPPQQQPQQQQIPYGSAAAASGGGYPVYPPQPGQMYHPSQQPPPPSHYTVAATGMGGQMPQQPIAYGTAAGVGGMPQPMIQGLQPRVGRLTADRPIMKLSVNLIETYKQINHVYYEEREARRAARASQRNQAPGQAGPGPQNNGWDDEHYDYILTPNEFIYNDRYQLQKRIGKGSFGQVVKAIETQTKKEVAIKIIKSKKPFLMQAKTEISLLKHLNDNDPDDDHNIVRLIDIFMYRNHQCIVFEMLSMNLYELLKNTHFLGVSLNLIRKFAKQILKGLAYLARPDIDIIHCDLKPENILLRHPKRSGIKVIDFGSSCKSSKRMYSYIQSRFYRSPEVMLGLAYSVAIDMWSLGCILVEMHTGEPLFSGTDQFDQMQKIVQILGMVPDSMLARADDQHRNQFFQKTEDDDWTIKQSGETTITPSKNPTASLKEVVEQETSKKKKYDSDDANHTARQYDLFVDLIYKMLAYEPRERITPEVALRHPFITERH